MLRKTRNFNKFLFDFVVSVNTPEHLGSFCIIQAYQIHQTTSFFDGSFIEQRLFFPGSCGVTSRSKNSSISICAICVINQLGIDKRTDCVFAQHTSLEHPVLTASSADTQFAIVTMS
jgi:hypothetical protein